MDMPSDLQFPLSANQWLLTAFCAIGGALAASSGIGGGVIFVPLMVLLVNMPIRYASPISNFVIACSASTTFIMNLCETHPKDDKRPLITFEALIYFVPIAVSSTSLGVMLSKALPEWLTNMLLFGFLSFTSYRTLRRGFKVFFLERAQHRKKARKSLSGSKQDTSVHALSDRDYLLIDAMPEKMEADKLPEIQHRIEAVRALKSTEIPRMKKAASVQNISQSVPEHNIYGSISPKQEEDSVEEDSEETDDGGSVPSLKDFSVSMKSTEDITIELRAATDSVTQEPPKPKGLARLRKYIRRKREKFGITVGATHWWYWMLIFGTWAFQLALSVGQSAMPRCSAGFWAVYAIQPFVGITCGLLVGHLLLNEEDGSKQYQSQEGDIVLGESKKTMLKLMVLCILIGAVGGLLGVGGGSILAPILLELGASPPLVAPLSAALVLFSSSQAAVQYATRNMLLWNYAIWIGAVNLVANFVGLYAVKKVVRQLGYTSFIILSLALLLVLAGLFTLSFLIESLVEEGFTKFPKYC